MAFLCCFNGPIEEGERALAPLRAFGPPVADLIEPMPYRLWQSALDAGFAHGQQVYWRSDFITELSDGAIDTLVEQYGKITSPTSALVLEEFGGAVRRVGAERPPSCIVRLTSTWQSSGCGPTRANLSGTSPGRAKPMPR